MVGGVFLPEPTAQEAAMESFDKEALERLGAAARDLNRNSARGANAASPSQAAGAGRAAPVPAAGPVPALWLATRVLGAAAVLAVGAIHLHEYNQIYSAIPTIGTLFVLNFAGATAIGLGLLAPLERLVGPSPGRRRSRTPCNRGDRPRRDRVRVPCDQRAHAAVRLHGAGLRPHGHPRLSSG